MINYINNMIVSMLDTRLNDMSSKPDAPFAGAGASVPLLGFGNVLWTGVQKAVDENGFIGIFMGGFTSSAVGISAALLFGYLAALVFEPKMKK